MTTAEKYPKLFQDVTKIIRQELRAAFPGTRFSVRYHRYTHYEEITIAWKDGPTEQEINAAISNHRAQLRKGKYIRIHRNI